jgi:hypothetical protein
MDFGLSVDSRVAGALTKSVRLSGRLSGRMCVAVEQDVVATVAGSKATLDAAHSEKQSN